jgi:hypothetical protein
MTRKGTPLSAPGAGGMCLKTVRAEDLSMLVMSACLRHARTRKAYRRRSGGSLENECLSNPSALLLFVEEGSIPDPRSLCLYSLLPVSSPSRREARPSRSVSCSIILALTFPASSPAPPNCRAIRIVPS